MSDLYLPSDGPAAALPLPGEYPYTRGVQPTMYRGRFWTMRQYAGFGTAAQSNERYHYLMSQGTKGLSVAFDLPTQMGYDSDSARARGEVGKVGVAIDSIADMEILYDQLPLDMVSTSMMATGSVSVQIDAADTFTLTATNSGGEVTNMTSRGPARMAPATSGRRR